MIAEARHQTVTSLSMDIKHIDILHWLLICPRRGITAICPECANNIPQSDAGLSGRLRLCGHHRELSFRGSFTVIRSPLISAHTSAWDDAWWIRDLFKSRNPIEGEQNWVCWVRNWCSRCEAMGSNKNAPMRYFVINLNTYMKHEVRWRRGQKSWCLEAVAREWGAKCVCLFTQNMIIEMMRSVLATVREVQEWPFRVL